MYPILHTEVVRFEHDFCHDGHFCNNMSSESRLFLIHFIIKIIKTKTGKATEKGAFTKNNVWREKEWG